MPFQAMPFQSVSNNGTIEVIAHRDVTVKCDKAAYKAYQKSFGKGAPDEAILQLEGEPHRFIMKCDLEYQEKQKLRGKNIKIENRKTNVSVNMSMEMIRFHLVGIKNPPNCPEDQMLKFSKDSDGLVSKELVNKLDIMGLIGNLITAVRNATDPAETADEKN